MGELAIFNYGGSETITWDPGTDSEVRTARTRFDEMVEKGFSAIEVNPDEGAGNSIDHFDPAATRILMFPFLAGG
ncbi:MAG: hypothetical protein V3S89_15545 [Desulfobacterales bacterium]